ncbi:hypothetical protein ACFLYA_02365 [Candidatus Dependentiae bacterium]
MNTYAKFKSGVLTSMKSFGLLWNNKKLLVYLGIPICLGIFTEILAYNIKIISCSKILSFSLKENIIRILTLAQSYSWLLYVGVLSAYFLYLAILTFGNIALTHHSAIIYKKNKIGLRQNTFESLKKIKSVLIWTACILVPIVSFYLINARIQKTDPILMKLFYSFITFFLFASWSLITSFVIQAIALDNTNIRNAIKKSIMVIKRKFFEYVGVISWLALVVLLSATPFIILEQYVQKMYYLSIPVILVAYCFISSAYTVSKTMLYIDSKKK